ncbi:MAG: helix-turn-helix domain-containing protein [Nitrososphaerota archaeon]
MFEGVLSVRAPSYCPLAIPRQNREAVVAIKSLKRRGERLSHLAVVSSSKPLTISKRVLQRYSLKPVNPYNLDSRSKLSIFETPICPLYEALCDTSCLLIHENAFRGGAYWTVCGQSKTDIRYLVKLMHDYDVEAELEEIYRMDGKRVLTRRQGEAIYAAYQKGYFDYPHKISLRELARQMGCSAPTLSILLRRGTKKIMEDFMRQEVGQPV